LLLSFWRNFWIFSRNFYEIVGKFRQIGGISPPAGPRIRSVLPTLVRVLARYFRKRKNSFRNFRQVRTRKRLDNWHPWRRPRRRPSPPQWPTRWPGGRRRAAARDPGREGPFRCWPSGPFHRIHNACAPLIIEPGGCAARALVHAHQDIGRRQHQAHGVHRVVDSARALFVRHSPPIEEEAGDAGRPQFVRRGRWCSDVRINRRKAGPLSRETGIRRNRIDVVRPGTIRLAGVVPLERYGHYFFRIFRSFAMRALAAGLPFFSLYDFALRFAVALGFPTFRGLPLAFRARRRVVAPLRPFPRAFCDAGDICANPASPPGGTVLIAIGTPPPK